MREPTGLDVVYWMSAVPFGDEITKPSPSADLDAALNELFDEMVKLLRVDKLTEWLTRRLTR